MIVALILIFGILTMVFLIGIGIHKDSELPSFNFDKKYLEQKQDTYLGIYKSTWGLVGFNTIKKKWIILNQENVRVSENCYIEYNKNVIQNGFNDPYLINCDINNNLCTGTCGMETKRYTKKDLLSKGFQSYLMKKIPK